ncbi:RNA-binding S4 domain-containing protein [Rubritalea tangerina]|uniref:RNA-binding S4 domain-containing protein n=1 Tax=Rubritalea tangerina TaxID=430798 RepID=A0ABW4Z9T6_9BACT
MSEDLTAVRIDKWLWAVRLFKTRSLAAQACNAGKVKRSNTSIKASTLVRVGDHLDVPTHDGLYKRHIEVTALLDKRVSAPIAMASYTDHTSEDTLKQAQEKRAEKRANRLLRKEGDQGRMTKKQMRDWKKGLHSYKKQQGEI